MYSRRYGRRGPRWMNWRHCGMITVRRRQEKPCLKSISTTYNLARTTSGQAHTLLGHAAP